MMSSEGAPRASEMLVSSGRSGHDTEPRHGGRCGAHTVSVGYGPYEMEEPISSGAMGAVYRARHRDSGREVALKQLLEGGSERRFEAEARLLSALEHPRVVEVLDHFESDGERFLVMELVNGPDLEDLLYERGNPGLPVDEAVDYTRQACEALVYVHQQHVVHRDVKPENLILGPDGVVLVDFGIAREYETNVGGTAVIGTPGFMAPEVFGGIISPRCDVYGVAATLWTLIAGDPPRYGDLTEIGVQPQLQAALNAGLAFDPNRRTASVEAFAAALGTRLAPAAGASLARSVETPGTPRTLLEAVVRAAAGVFEAASSSLALLDRSTGELVYEAAWGAGAREILGIRLDRGVGLAGAVAASGQGEAVPDCRADPRFAAGVAAGTGYMPGTMLVVPMRKDGETFGVLSLLDRRDGRGYGPDDVERAGAFADLALMAADLQLSGPTTQGF
jgi:tRNA A-37 threonylcarbamoyl transferase component Bud32